MDVVQTIFALMERHRVTAYRLSKATGISNGNFTDWKKGRTRPSRQALEKIADYFDVSIDTLLGKRSPPPEELPEIFRTMAHKTSALTEEQQQHVHAILDRTVDELIALLRREETSG